MNSSRSNRPAPLTLEGHTAVPPRRPTNSTDASTPQGVVARRLVPILRPTEIAFQSSPEPVSNAVPDLNSNTSSRSSNEATVATGAHENSFARDAVRCARAESDARVDGSSSRNTGLAAPSNGSGEVGSSLHSTPSEFYFPHSVHVEDTPPDQNAATHAGSSPRRLSAERNHKAPSSPPRLESLETSVLSPFSDTIPSQRTLTPASGEQRSDSSTELSINAVDGTQIFTGVGRASIPYIPSSPGLMAQPRVLQHYGSYTSLQAITPHPNVTMDVAASSPIDPAEFTTVPFNRDELPLRKEPPALTTFDRFGRWSRHNFVPTPYPTFQEFELTNRHHRIATETDPHLFLGAEANRSRQQQNPDQNGGLQVQQAQESSANNGDASQRNLRRWAWVCFIVGTVVIIGGSVLPRYVG